MRFSLALLAASALSAQPFVTRLGTEAVDFQGGIGYGHGNGRAYTAIDTKLRAGLNRFLSLYGEYGYMPEIHEDLNLINGQPIDLKVRGSFMDISGGAEAHWSGARVQPYILAGFGTTRISAKASVGASHLIGSDYHFAQTLGGGVRVFATPHIGFSVEAKTIWLPSQPGRYDRFGVGIFYQGFNRGRDW